MAKADSTTQTEVPDGRLCAGSTRFNIPQHRAPAADFRLQPSAKDGLGRMCKPHWTEYTGSLRRAANERKGIEPKPATAKAERAPRAATEPKASRALQVLAGHASGPEVHEDVRVRANIAVDEAEAEEASRDTRLSHGAAEPAVA